MGRILTSMSEWILASAIPLVGSLCCCSSASLEVELMTVSIQHRQSSTTTTTTQLSFHRIQLGMESRSQICTQSVCTPEHRHAHADVRPGSVTKSDNDTGWQNALACNLLLKMTNAPMAAVEQVKDVSRPNGSSMPCSTVYSQSVGCAYCGCPNNRFRSNLHSRAATSVKR